ncbi:archease [candidate division WOR-3 bacterium]|nr:archease [candidate division WOR-3 bacterium]
MNYRFFDHTADVGIEARGKSLSSMFKSSAQAVLSIMKDRNRAKTSAGLYLELKSDRVENLLIEFISEIIYISEVKSILPSEIRMLKVKKLQSGEYLMKVLLETTKAEKNSRPRKSIKGATFSGLSVEEKDGSFCARFILDV